MKNDKYLAMQQTYKIQMEKQSLIQDVLSEIAELEKEPIIKRYITLKKLLTSAEVQTEDYIIDNIINRYSPKNAEETNHIYYCLGLYSDDLSGIFHKNHILIKYGSFNKEATYKLYANIETTCDIVKVPIEDCQEFEKNNFIIFPEDLLSGEDEYFEIQREFYITAMTENQEATCKKILKKYQKN